MLLDHPVQFLMICFKVYSLKMPIKQNQPFFCQQSVSCFMYIPLRPMRFQIILPTVIYFVKNGNAMGAQKLMN